MTDFVFTPPAQVSLPIQGKTAEFPVRRVYCIGRNYAAHAIEMGHDPDKEAPFFFQKNAENLISSENFPYPVKSSDVHHEIELAVLLKSGGTSISIENALDHVFGYAVSLDMTRRDLQGQMKKAGRPWEIGKAFEDSAPISEVTPIENATPMDQGKIELKVNGEIRQSGDLNQMIWKVPEMISYLSDYFELAAGDVILSGTPSGVGPVEVGDQLEGVIDGLTPLKVTVV